MPYPSFGSVKYGFGDFTAQSILALREMVPWLSKVFGGVVRSTAGVIAFFFRENNHFWRYFITGCSIGRYYFIKLCLRWWCTCAAAYFDTSGTLHNPLGMNF